MRAPTFARELMHPLPMSAALVLALNDHVLKHAGILPGWFTGKLSDVTGLFVAPLVLLAGIRLVARRDDPAAKFVAVTSTAAVFAALKTSSHFNAFYNYWIATAVLDPTDLLALPACALSAWWMTRTRTRPALSGFRPIATRAAFVVSALSCVATSKQYEPRPANGPEPPAPPPHQPCAGVQLVGDLVTPEPRVIVRAQRLQYRDACRLQIRVQEFVDKANERLAYEGIGATTVDLTNDAVTELAIPVQLPYPTTCATARTVRVSVDQYAGGRLVSVDRSAQMRQTCLPSQEIVAP